MGLDIHLYPKAVSEANKLHYQIWEEDEEGNYPYKTMTEEERREHEQRYPRVRYEVDSEQFPKHYFKRTYLRSSYNPGGFNSVVAQVLGEALDLYWMFDDLGRDWRSGEDEAPLTVADIPGLREAKRRANHVADRLAEAEPYAVMSIDTKIWYTEPTLSDDQALEKFREELKRPMPNDMGWYANAVGEWFHNQNPPVIYAAIPGVGVLGYPVVHLIYKREDWDWYIQAARIVAEFCDEAIMLIERDGSCEISWSG